MAGQTEFLQAIQELERLGETNIPSTCRPVSTIKRNGTMDG